MPTSSPPPDTRGGRRSGSGRRPLSADARTVQRAVSMTTTDWDAIDAAAREAGISRSAFIREKLSLFFEDVNGKNMII